MHFDSNFCAVFSLTLPCSVYAIHSHCTMAVCGFYSSIHYVRFFRSILCSAEYLLLTSLSYCLFESEHTYKSVNFHYEWRIFITEIGSYNFTSITIRVELFYHMLNWSIEMYYTYLGYSNTRIENLTICDTTCSGKKGIQWIVWQELKNELNQNRWAKPHCEKGRERWTSIVYNYYPTKCEQNGTRCRCENWTAFSFFIFKCVCSGRWQRLLLPLL